MTNAPAPIPPSAVVDLTADLLGYTDNDLFALKAHHMEDAMISDGDIVVCKKVDHARNGEAVAAFLVDEGQTVLRHYFMEAGQVRLQPLNPTRPGAIFAPDKVQVHGRVMLVVRRMN